MLAGLSKLHLYQRCRSDSTSCDTFFEYFLRLWKQ